MDFRSTFLDDPGYCLGASRVKLGPCSPLHQQSGRRYTACLIRMGGNRIRLPANRFPARGLGSVRILAVGRGINSVRCSDDLKPRPGRGG